MINYSMELVLFFVPGLLTEFFFCLLKERKSAWMVKLSRVFAFSMLCLALRCALSVISGHGGLEISVLFHGIGNYLKYCILAVIEVIVLPPCLLILEKLLLHWEANVTTGKGGGHNG